MKSILDRSFKYVPAAKTDLRETFARIRREQRALEAERVRVVDPFLIGDLWKHSTALRALEGPTPEEVASAKSAIEVLGGDPEKESCATDVLRIARAILRWAGRDERRERGE